MYGCESWTIKKAEHQRIDTFEPWWWRRLLRVPWTTRRSNQSTLMEISPEFSLEGLMLKLKLQYFGKWCKELPHLKRPWCWERLKSGGKGDNGGWDAWMASLTWWTWVWANCGSGWWTGKPGMLQFKSINSLVLSFLYGPNLTSIHDYWKNHSFDLLCWQRNVSSFKYAI